MRGYEDRSGSRGNDAAPWGARTRRPDGYGYGSRLDAGHGGDRYRSDYDYGYGYGSSYRYGDYAYGRDLAADDRGYGHRPGDERSGTTAYSPPWRARALRKPAHGFPVRGFHTYDLDYGRQAGGPSTEYSGRAGYSDTPDTWAWRGPYAFDIGAPRGGRGYRPRYEERHWSAAEPAWRRRAGARGSLRGYRDRPGAVERAGRVAWYGPGRGYAPRREAVEPPDQLEWPGYTPRRPRRGM